MRDFFVVQGVTTLTILIMSDKELIYERLQEKARLKKAHRQITFLFILSSSLIFFTFLFIWLVKRTPDIKVPLMYYFNMIAILLSSGAIYIGDKNIRLDRLEIAVLWIKVGIILGFLFTILQLGGIEELIHLNASFQNILFPVAIIHFLHVGVGMWLLFRVVRRLKNYEIHSKSPAFAHNVFVFWHFLGGLWVLFIALF